MIIRYTFVTGEVSETEVTDELGETLIDLDRQEYNNDHKEPRRHVLMSVATSEQKMQFPDPGSDPHAHEMEAQLEAALLVLTDEQRDLVRTVLIGGMPASKYAKRVGVSPSAITQRLRTVREKLRKVLGQP